MADAAETSDQERKAVEEAITSESAPGELPPGAPWNPVEEAGKLIALTDETGASITLEPGGQLELSGAILDNIHQTCTEVNTHLKQVRAVSEPLGVAFSCGSGALPIGLAVSVILDPPYPATFVYGPH